MTAPTDTRDEDNVPTNSIHYGENVVENIMSATEVLHRQRELLDAPTFSEYFDWAENVPSTRTRKEKILYWFRDMWHMLKDFFDVQWVPMQTVRIWRIEGNEYAYKFVEGTENSWSVYVIAQDDEEWGTFIENCSLSKVAEIESNLFDRGYINTHEYTIRI